MSAAPAPAETAAARVPVKHHVYTSFGGYGSLKSSDDLEPEVLEHLDHRVAPLAAAASRSPLRSSFPVGRYVAITSSFMVGVDHAGRPRAVAHTILVDRSVSRAAPWFLPLGVDAALFVGPDTAAGALGEKLAPDVSLDLLCPPINPEEVEAAARAPAASALLAALASRRARTAAIGEPVATIRILALLSALVPAARRCEVSVFSGAGVAGDTGVSDGAVVLVLRQAAELHDEGVARIDVATGSLEGRLIRGLAAYALSCYLERRDPHAMAALEGCFARWAEAEDAGEPPRAFVRAFAELRPYVRADGSIALDDAAWPHVAAAIPAASEGGARGLAAALLQDGVARAKDGEALRAIIRTIREAAAAAPLPLEPRRFLAAEVAATMQGLTEGRGTARRSRAPAADALRAVAAEAEALLALLCADGALDGATSGSMSGPVSPVG
jgi:hypothetical protein